MKRQQTTAEYLHSFLPTGFQLSMKRKTIPAFAELLFGFMMDVEKERFAEEGIAEEPDDVDEHSLREIRATPADEKKAWQKKWKACCFGGKKYTSLNALADLADVSLGQAYKGVQKMGKWIREDEI